MEKLSDTTDRFEGLSDEWIICYPMNANYIYYSTADLYPEKFMMTKREFTEEYIPSICHPVIGYQDFCDEINSFATLILDIKRHNWKRIHVTYSGDNDYTFEELLALNSDKAYLVEKKAVNDEESLPQKMKNIFTNLMQDVRNISLQKPYDAYSKKRSQDKKHNS